MLKSSFGTGQVCTEHNDVENKKKTSQNTWKKSEKGFHGGSVGKEFTCKTGDLGLIPVWKIPSRREWLPTPVFLPGEFHGRWRIADYRPCGCKESDMTEQLLTFKLHKILTD